MATIQELESFKLSDAVKFHAELNPQLWEDHKLDPEVRNQLLLIAEDFTEYLGLDNLKVVDVAISGSNAAYSYTPHSDLDLHILVDFSKLPDNPVYQELFTAKKTLYNDQHDITVHGVPVELYVQDTNQPVESLGEYSIIHDRWIRVPKKRKANFDQAATKLKYEKLGNLIELALKSKNSTRIDDTIALIKRYRKAGLDKSGEFGPENLAYKAIRKQGLIKELYDLKSKLHTEKLSIEEENILLNRPTFTIDQLAKIHRIDRMELAKQLDKGIKVELEHTNHRDIAREIALDHLAEDPRYYDKLSNANLEEDYDYSAWGYWITNDGEIVPVGYLSHDLVAKRLGFKSKEDMVASGAIRVTGSNISDVHSISNPSRRAVRSLAKLLKQVDRADKIWYADETTGDFKGVTPGELMQRLSGTVNEASGYIPSKKEKNDPRYNVMDEKEQLDEIGFADALTNLSLSDQEIIDNATIAGTIGKTPVRIFKRGSSTLYFFATDNRILALVLLDGTYLKAIKNFTSEKGMIYSLLNYIVNMEGLHINIAPSEPFTSEGFQWLLRLANNTHGLRLTTADGHEVDQPTLKREWNTAKLTKKPGETGLVISEMSDSWKNRLIENENSLMPFRIFEYTDKLTEASGYIPSKKEKNDPRFKTALTRDVRPDANKKNAAAFGWKVSRAGIPLQANPNGKIEEDLMKEWKSFLAEDEQQQELFPGYDEQHREKRLGNWLQSTHAWDGHKPMTFYHATTKEFDTFNTHGTGFASALGMAFEVERHGSFFAVDPKFAETFIEDPNTREYKTGGRVIPVHLSVQNPIDLRDNNLSYMLRDDETVDGFKDNDIDLRSIYYHVPEDMRWELFDGAEGEDFVNNLQKLGFDGAIINEAIPNDSNARSGEVWVVFNPNQVKAIHNRGSFSPDDPRMMKENG